MSSIPNLVVFMLALFLVLPACMEKNPQVAVDGSPADQGRELAGPAGCTDGVKNGAETDVDCGGGTCQPCTVKQQCLAGTDCVTGVCAAGACAAATCTDKAKNGIETDVDCGGGDCPPCADGNNCASGTDCVSAICSGGSCAKLVCGDKVCEGNETCITCKQDCGACQCTPGQTGTSSGGCSSCEQKTRTCLTNGKWGAYGACTAYGNCTIPGVIQARTCGNCGTQSRTCSSSCVWGSWSACSGQGCKPGTTKTSGCGPCSAKKCTSSCTWPSSCDVCTTCKSHTVCGSYCPPGHHVKSRVCNKSCGICSYPPKNQLNCQPTCGASISVCGYVCPSGYYVSSRSCKIGCSTLNHCYQYSYTSVFCRLITGPFLYVCGGYCPSGYSEVSKSCSTACGYCKGSVINRVYCKKN